MSQENNFSPPKIKLPIITEFEYRILYSILNRVYINMKKLPDGEYAFSAINLEFEMANGAYKTFHELLKKIDRPVSHRAQGGSL
jgi:hypothetical protein